MKEFFERVNLENTAEDKRAYKITQHAKSYILEMPIKKKISFLSELKNQGVSVNVLKFERPRQIGQTQIVNFNIGFGC